MPEAAASVVSTVPWLRAGHSRVQTSAMTKDFTLPQNSHACTQTHIVSQSMGKGALPFGLRGRAGPGRRERVRIPMKTFRAPPKGRFSKKS
jgi:hypothetical protein